MSVFPGGEYIRTTTRLPRELPPDRFRDTAISAYNLCLEVEEELENELAAGKDVQRNLTYCRIVGYLFHHAPGTQGVKTITWEVLSCDGDHGKLLAVGRQYFDYFLRVCQSNKGRTPEPASHPSRPSFDALAEATKAKMVKAHPNHASAKIDALVRDGYRCVVTGYYDSTAMLHFPKIREEIMSDQATWSATECAHIIGESINVGFDTQASKKEYAANVSSVLTRFGYEQIPKELNGDLIHRLENVITLSEGVHKTFGKLQFWFVATDEIHKYKLKSVYPVILKKLPEYVTFTTPDAKKYPLPSPDYLRIHAACCEVTNLSGAAEYIEQYYRDMEMTGVLSTDGSSAMLLEEALRQVSHGVAV